MSPFTLLWRKKPKTPWNTPNETRPRKTLHPMPRSAAQYAAEKPPNATAIAIANVIMTVL